MAQRDHETENHATCPACLMWRAGLFIAAAGLFLLWLFR
jgi:hypothetical protein